MNLDNLDAKTTREDFMVDGVVQPEETDIAIYGLYGKYRCLSNFHTYPIEVDGLTYSCSEAAYMAQKTLDPKLRKKFSDTFGPKEAKKMGRLVELRPNWDTIRVHAMYKVLLCKFSQDYGSRKVLLSTGNKYLEETNWWEDRFWGVCGGEGENHLGWTLMTIRDYMR